MTEFKILLIPGDGIGAEIVSVAEQVMIQVAARAGLSENEKASVFSNTAAKAYRLGQNP